MIYVYIYIYSVSEFRAAIFHILRFHVQVLGLKDITVVNQMDKNMETTWKLGFYRVL